MKKLLAGECRPENIFHLVDPTEFTEVEFEAEVVKALTCLMPEYTCGVFAGAFVLENERRVADLALLHKRLTHWIVVEVEMAGHSLEHHVLPQVRCFRYGEPEESCVTSLARAFHDISRERAIQILNSVPRSVAVVSNMHDPTWTSSLGAVDVQHLSVSVFRDSSGRSAHTVEGTLTIRAESLGFARYSAIDNCLRIPKSTGVPIGSIHICDQFGNAGEWTSRDENGVLWLHKERGPALIPHDSYVQIIRSYDGTLSLRPTPG